MAKSRHNPPRTWRYSQKLQDLFERLNEEVFANARSYAHNGKVTNLTLCGYNKTKHAGGYCYYRVNLAGSRINYIAISENLPEAQLEEVMKHEMCHAALPLGAKHGIAFKSLMRAVGATRFCSGVRETAMVRGPHVVFECPDCGYEYRQFRSSRRGHWCGKCYTLGKRVTMKQYRVV